MKVRLEKNDVVRICPGEYFSSTTIYYGKIIDGKETIDDYVYFEVDFGDALDWFGYEDKSNAEEIYNNMREMNFFIKITKDNKGKVKYSLCEDAELEDDFEECEEETSKVIAVSKSSLNNIIEKILNKEITVNL